MPYLDYLEQDDLHETFCRVLLALVDGDHEGAHGIIKGANAEDVACYMASMILQGWLGESPSDGDREELRQDLRAQLLGEDTGDTEQGGDDAP
jgi:hypothetical protein